MKNYFLFLFLKNTDLLQHISLFPSGVAFKILFDTSVPYTVAQLLNEQTVMSKAQMAYLQMRTSLYGLLLIQVTSSKTVSG